MPRKPTRDEFRENFKTHRLDFYVTPGDVFWDDDLSDTEQRLLVFIAYLDQGARGCYASNTYLAAFCRKSERYVQIALAHFADRGFLEGVDSWNGEERNIFIASEYRPLLKGEYHAKPSRGRADSAQGSRRIFAGIAQNLRDYMDESGKELYKRVPDAHKSAGKPDRTPKPQRVVDLDSVPQDVIEAAKARIAARVHIKCWTSIAAQGALRDEIAQMMEVSE